MPVKNLFSVCVLLVLFTAPALASAPDSTKAYPTGFNKEIDENNAMLLDAMLELNEALLAGVRASLDTLNVPVKNNYVPKDTADKLRIMRRDREQKEMRAYLEHMRDSLNADNIKIKKEKEVIEARLNPPVVQKAEPVIAKPETANNQTKNHKQEKTEKPVKVEPKKVEKAPVPAVAKKEPEKKKEPEPANTQKQKEEKKKQEAEKQAIADAKKNREKKQAEQLKLAKESEEFVKDSLAKAQNLAEKKKQEEDKQARADAKKKEPKNEPVKTKAIEEKKAVRKDTVVVIDMPVAKAKAITEKEKEKTDTKKDKKTPEVITAKKDTRLATDTVAKVSVVKPAIAVKQPSPAVDTATRIKSNYYVALAQKALVEKDLKKAAENLNTATNLWPENYDAWFALAGVHTDLGETDKAMDDYEHCFHIDSAKPKLFFNRAGLYLQMGGKGEALRNLNKALQLDPGYIAAYMKRGTVHNDNGNYDAAIADYDQVFRINKSYYAAYKARGYSKLMKRSFTQAMDDFTRYIIYDQTDPQVYYYRGLAKIGNNEWLDGCLELSMSANMGYTAAATAMKKNCD